MVSASHFLLKIKLGVDRSHSFTENKVLAWSVLAFCFESPQFFDSFDLEAGWVREAGRACFFAVWAGSCYIFLLLGRGRG